MATRKDDSSLDFTRPGKPAKPRAAKPPASAKAPARSAPVRRKTPVIERDGPPGSGRWGVLFLVLVSTVAVAVWATREPPPPQPPARPKAATAKPAPVAPPATATAPAPAQPYPPPTKLQIPEPSAAKGVPVSALPPEFLKAVQAYNTRAGYKALALVLDPDGKFGYGTIAGAATQKAANDDALAECAKFREQSGAQSDCRLFAVGDRIVW